MLQAMKEEMSQVLRAVPDIEKLVKYVPETYFSGMLDFAAVDNSQNYVSNALWRILKQLVLELDHIEMSPHIDTFLEKKNSSHLEIRESE